MHSDELRTLRADAAGVLAALDAAREGGTRRVPMMVGSVTSSGTNIGLNKYLMVTPVKVSGVNAEGVAGSGVPGAGTVPVLLLGPSLPATGEYLLCRFIDYRWVAERSGPSTSVPPGYALIGCPCTNIPGTLFCRVPSPDYSDFGYPYLRPATLRWQSAPADCPSASIYTGYWSDELFEYYPSGATITPYRFRYFLRCVIGSYRLNYWYTDTSLGAADTGFYELFTWATFSPNTCTPFTLRNGNDAANPLDTDHGRIQIWTSP